MDLENITLDGIPLEMEYIGTEPEGRCYRYRGMMEIEQDELELNFFLEFHHYPDRCGKDDIYIDKIKAFYDGIQVLFTNDEYEDMHRRIEMALEPRTLIA